MNSDFPRILTLLRKERNISQKEAAGQLGVSQGLLSHYEKGKRECGLGFIVKAADYYNVSCDYLLGRSAEPQGKFITIDELPEYDPSQKEKVSPGGVMVAFYKKLIINSIEVFFGLLTKCKSSTVIKESGSYLMLAVYQMFRKVFSANPKNDENFFTVERSMASPAASAAMALSEARITAAVNQTAVDGVDCVQNPEELVISNSSLSESFAPYYLSMMNLIKNSEAKINIISGADK